MEELNCLAVDDEPLALTQIASYIGKIPGLKLVAQCHSALDALAILGTQDVDVLFADISMPDMSGLDLVRQVAGRCHVIFTTAYPDYALDGYKVEAVDYLLKPYTLADVTSAIDKVRRRRHAIEQPAATQQPHDDQCLFLKDGTKMLRVSIDDITMVEGMSEYVRIYKRSADRPITTLLTMRRLEEILPQDKFMRVHRSWIINLTAIESVSHMRISICDKLIAVSDAYKDKFNDYIAQHAIK